MKPRVFVSYKRKEKTGSSGDTEALADRLDSALAAAGYDVLRDKGIGPVNADWHQAIDDALAAAQCAVVLLSPAALHSPSVKYELSVLVHRSRTSRRLALVIALIDLEPSALDEPSLAPLKVAALQLFRKRRAVDVAKGRNEYDDEDDLHASLIREVKAVRPPTSDREQLVADLAQLFTPYSWLCEQVEKRLGLTVPPEDGGRLTWLTEELLRMNLDQYCAFFEVLAAHPRASPVDLGILLERAFQFWVDSASAADLIAIGDRQEVPLLRVSDDWTVLQVVRRAEEYPRHWRVVDARLPGGEDSDDDACLQALNHIASKSLADSVLRRINPATVESLFCALNKRVRTTVWFPIVDSVEAAERLRAFRCTWLRPIVVDPDVREGELVRAVHPPIELEREREARDAYQYLEHILRQLPTTGPRS